MIQQNGIITFTNLDSRKPYSLGNREFQAVAKRTKCGSTEFYSESGHYDGFSYENVYCENCHNYLAGEAVDEVQPIAQFAEHFNKP